jgi:signal transduction histidine kinase/CheY-like chemotaxis protein
VPIEAHFGKTPEEIVPQRAAEARRVFQQVIETGHAVLDYEFQTDGPAGAARSWLERWFPVRSADGRLIGVGATVVETTERKRAEKAREDLERKMLEAQRLESIGLLAGGIAHDFNNLLTGILGNASLAEEFATAETPLAICLEEIVKAGQRAAHLTKQMLAYAGKGRFVIESVDLSRETEEVVRLVQPSISKKIEIQLTLPKNLPPVAADKGQVQQVIMNLVVNAAEAIGSLPGILSIRTGVRKLTERHIRSVLSEAAIEPGVYSCLEVRDSGCGMDEATKARIFDPFFTTKFTGRGLGLAAVSGIVRSHKGGIYVKSSPGQGSTFQVYFPVASQPAAAGRQETRRLSVQISPGQNILVVDDERVILRMAQSALERQGCRVLVAESGPAAIELFRRHAQEISLIILDLSMPGMSGLEALPLLHKIRDDVPVLISSGYSESETLRLFSGQKISGFLQKPYTSQHLLERVEAIAAKLRVRWAGNPIE